MNYKLLLHTVVHLKAIQVYFQLRNRLVKFRLKDYSHQGGNNLNYIPFIPKYSCLNDGEFSFLNLSDRFKTWNDDTKGMLWAYNLNYMDYLLQPNLKKEDGLYWIDKFIIDISKNKVGLDPYPIALRSINWIKFFVTYPDTISQSRNNALYSQYKLLEKKLEYHLLGNHLLEDAYSLFIGAIYFKDENMFKRSSKLLLKQLNEQVLDDGAHYEQSPMYHCILLDRLLDCYNFTINNKIWDTQDVVNERLRAYAVKMLGHLESIVWNDKTIPLLNDAANGIAPIPNDIFEYARRLNLSWKPLSLGECGYRKFASEQMEAIIDVGNITATYQAGHTQADTFNYELRINGKPFIVDTGISTYNKTARRQYERGSSAHNVVTINDLNSSEVWGGFRVGKRAKVRAIQNEKNLAEFVHDGLGKSQKCYRLFLFGNNFIIEDKIDGDNIAISHIHLSPNVRILTYNNDEVKTETAIIKFENALHLNIVDGQVSTEYNKLENNKEIVVGFKHQLKYTIRAI